LLKSDGLFWNFLKSLVLFVKPSNNFISRDDLAAKVNTANTIAIVKIGIFSIEMSLIKTNIIEKNKSARTS
jgi:hypothetical protein